MEWRYHVWEAMLDAILKPSSEAQNSVSELKVAWRNIQSNHHHQQTKTQFFTGRMPFLSLLSN